MGPELFILKNINMGDIMALVKTEVYSRVCGYLRPVSNWNDAKQAEFGDRIKFDEITPDIYTDPDAKP